MLLDGLRDGATAKPQAQSMNPELGKIHFITATLASTLSLDARTAGATTRARPASAERGGYALWGYNVAVVLANSLPPDLQVMYP